MPRKAHQKNGYLEQREDGYYRVTMGVPKPLQPQLGTRLKQALGTKSLIEANARKKLVIQEFRTRIYKAWENIGGRQQSVLIEAAAWAPVMAEVGKPGDPSAEIYHQFLREREDDILAVGARYEMVVDDEGEVVEIEIPTNAAKEAAKQFREIALGQATPLGAHHAAFMKTLRIKDRSLADDVRALKIFSDWCAANEVPQFIERIDVKTAARFKDSIEGWANLSWASANKYVGRLRYYWDYLVEATHAPHNPWLRLKLKRPEVDPENEERPFTDTEVQKLLMGGASPAMMDVILIGALTGARLDAIIDLRVGECADGWFTFKPQKKERKARDVPIHPDLKALVAARVKGKRPEEDFFPEWPEPKSKDSIRERSGYFSKRFTAYRRTLGVDEQVEGKRRSLVNFHSFRRWFITKMERAGASGDLIAAIVGHKRSGLTLGRYSAGPEMEAAKRAIAKVKLPPLDGSPVLEAQPLTPRRRRRS